MADKQTITYETKFTLNYSDKDTRTVTIKNAKPINASDATDIRAKIDAYGAITVGDKSGATFVNSSNCYYVQQLTVDLDLEYNAG